MARPHIVCLVSERRLSGEQRGGEEGLIHTSDSSTLCTFSQLCNKVKRKQAFKLFYRLTFRYVTHLCILSYSWS